MVERKSHQKAEVRAYDGAKRKNRFQFRTLKRLYGLKWWTPIKMLPHGMFGALVFFLGLFITIGSLIGRPVDQFWNAPFGVLAFLNALGGIILADKSADGDRFRMAGSVQLALAWVVLRFDQSADFVPLAQVLDVIATCLMFGAELTIWSVSSVVESSAMKIAIRVGVIGLAALSIYPVHFALNGNVWMDCVVNRWPHQRRAFLQYVFIPATWMLATMLFGATLRRRKIINDRQFGIYFGLGVGLTVLANVMMQEVHIPFVSTQKLYMPCPEPPAGTWKRWASTVFDLSPPAQRVIKAITMNDHFFD
eukprot:gene1299-275_t